ncbi:MAG: PAS domain S-box protein, partial [Chitinophagaceae bacterium]
MNDIGNMQSRIAESEKRENELKLKLEELTDFVENASLPLHWVDGNGIIIWANTAELESLGYTKEEYVGQPIGDFHADEPVINDILTRLTNNETLQNYPARLKCKDGSIKHVLINSNVLMKDGKFIHTRCFTRDITALKEEEQRKSALLKELEIKNQVIQSQSEELEKKIQEGIKEFKLKNNQLNEAQEIAKMGSWEWDVSTNKVSWTAGLFNVYKLPQEEEGLTYEKFLDKVHPEDRGIVEKTLKQSFADKKFYDYYHRIVTPSGDIKILQAKGEVILDENGEIVKMIGTGQDITEQKKVEQELLIKTTELQKINAELQKFAYIASHDLQEPLRKIKTFVGRLVSEDELMVTNEKSKIYLTKVADAASRMQRLMDDILNFSRLSSTLITYQQTDLDNT